MKKYVNGEYIEMTEEEIREIEEAKKREDAERAGMEEDAMSKLGGVMDKVTRLEKLAVTPTTDMAAFLHIEDSAAYPVLNFEMEGKTKQFTGIIQSEDGGEVSVPNPEYPQEIINAGVFNEDTGRYEIHCKVTGKNLFYKQNEYRATCDIPLAAGTTITCSAESDFEENIDITYIDGSKEALSLNQTINQRKSSVTYLLPKDVEQILFRQYTKEPQVEVGALTDYEPYHATEFVITSPEPLTKWDKLVKKDGVWGWSIWHDFQYNDVRESVLSGNGKSSDDYYRIYIEDIRAYRNAECVCNIAPYADHQMEGFCGFWWHDMLCMRVSRKFIGYTEEDTLEDIISKFRDNVLSKGITIQYKTDVEQSFIPLPEEEQAVLNKLETYYGVTNVSNDQGCPMRLKYVADTKLYIDKVTEQEIVKETSYQTLAAVTLDENSGGGREYTV